MLVLKGQGRSRYLKKARVRKTRTKPKLISTSYWQKDPNVLARVISRDVAEIDDYKAFGYTECGNYSVISFLYCAALDYV